MPAMSQTRTGHWRAVYAPGRTPPPLLVPAPLTQQPDLRASRRVIWHRVTTDPYASAHGLDEIPGSGWHGPVTVDGLWTCSTPFDVDGQVMVRVLPEWEHYAALRGASPTPVAVLADECWVLDTVPDAGDWDGTEGALGDADTRTDQRVTNPAHPATRRLRFAPNADVLVGQRAVTAFGGRDNTEPRVEFGWRVCSEPYAMDTTLPNIATGDLDDLDRPYTAVLVRLCPEADWFAALATGEPLTPADMWPVPLHHVFLE